MSNEAFLVAHIGAPVDNYPDSAVLLAVQFSLKRYVAPVYWAIVVVISVAGTQITDKFEGNGAQPAHMWAIGAKLLQAFNEAAREAGVAQIFALEG